MKIRDGDWSLFDYDFQTGRQVWSMTNPDGSTTFRTDYPVDATIAANKEQRNISQAGWSGDWHHVASVPLNTFHDELAEASRVGDDKYISKWLNDGDHAAWRTKGGTV